MKSNFIYKLCSCKVQLDTQCGNSKKKDLKDEVLLTALQLCP